MGLRTVSPGGGQQQAADALFDIPVPAPDTAEAGTAGGLAGQLRDTAAVAPAVAGDGFGWFADLLSPTPPLTCVRCRAPHVYRRPAGFVLACPGCFPTEVTA